MYCYVMCISLSGEKYLRETKKNQDDYVLEEKWQVAHVIPKVAHANIFVLENVS